MKRVLSILLLIIFVFNLTGYKALVYYFQKNAESAIEAKINSISNNDPELVMVRIPLHLPYQIHNKAFERVDGEITYKGTTIKYVKRKVLNDTLVLLCMNFAAKDKIRDIGDNYFKKVNDINSDPGKKHISKSEKLDNYYKPANTLLNQLFAVQTEMRSIYTTSPQHRGYLSGVFIPPDHLI